MAPLRLIGAAFLTLGLAGCDEAAMQAAGLSFAPVASPATPVAPREPIRAVALFDGDIRVQGPQGYCIDTATSRVRSGFVVMASCALVSDSTEIPRPAGVLTVQVGAAESAAVAGAEAEMAAFLQSPQGASLLRPRAGSGAVSDVEAGSREGLVTVHFTARGGGSSFQPDQWRGFLDLNGRLVTVALRGPAQAPLTRQQGERLLAAAVAILRDANPA